MGTKSMRALLQVPTDGSFELAGVDPSGTPGLPKDKAVKRDPKAWARERVAAMGPQLTDLQERVYASAKAQDDPRRILVILQAMDCGGKDGTVTHVMGQLNPLGLHLRAFGVPTPEERKHHFLWRIRAALPPAGYVGVFNRSHYEDVLIVRVHDLVPASRWQRRYGQINDFEHELVDSGITLLKIMLHISPEEQRKRLLKRLDDPTKYWKYNPGDVAERARWDDYQRAYQDALTLCSTELAPWHVVPADRKWYRDWAVGQLLHESLSSLNPKYPGPNFDIETERAKLRSSGS